MATGGTWYVLVYGNVIPSADRYTLVAQTSEVFLTGATPDHYTNTAPATLTLTGAGFISSTAVSLVAQNGTVYQAATASADSLTRITATFAANTVPAGTYSVEVSQPDGSSAELANVFTMVQGGQANLVTNLIVPSDVGRHEVSTIYVEYSNTGDAAMPAPILVLEGYATPSLLAGPVIVGGSFPRTRPSMTLDSSLVTQGFWESSMPEGFSNVIEILASGATPGMLEPGESVKVPVYYAGLTGPWNFSTDNNVQFNLGVLTTDNTTPIRLVLDGGHDAARHHQLAGLETPSRTTSSARTARPGAAISRPWTPTRPISAASGRTSRCGPDSQLRARTGERLKPRHDPRRCNG